MAVGESTGTDSGAHVTRTFAAGLVPAVQYGHGYVNLLAPEEKRQVSSRRGPGRRQRFVAGAFVRDSAGADFDLDAYRQGHRRGGRIRRYAGDFPVVWPDVAAWRAGAGGVLAIAKHCPRFIGFELGTMFAPFGRIYDLDVYGGLMAIPECIGAKHSSLDRMLEWQRLQLRNRHRPDFLVLTGNDLGIDMVMYGQRLLARPEHVRPDLFARRDALWLAGDPGFHELNDVLQYLGFFAFRPPVPAYKHSAAQFLKLRGWIASDEPHPQGYGGQRVMWRCCGILWGGRRGGLKLEDEFVKDEEGRQ